MLIHASKNKIWQLAPSCSEDSAANVGTVLGVSRTMARLLAVRGHDTPEKAKSFISKDKELLHDPFLLCDMDKAVDRICLALTKGEKIVVYGDYDVDGVTSVTTVYTYLAEKGANAAYYIPNRIGEGYGINIDALRSFAHSGCNLMITVDTGITAVEEIEEAAKLGLDVVVTDHHECGPEIPRAAAVVNPCRPNCDYPFPHLAGVGVAFKLICALEMRLSGKSMYDSVMSVAPKYCEFAAIGTIADVMPLTDENRVIVSYGLGLLENTKNIGLQSLMKASGLIAFDADGRQIKKKITSSSVGFTIAPRINAAGRIASAEFAVELFLTEDPCRAEELAAELCEINRRRQMQESSIAEEADAKIEKLCFEDDYVMVLDDDKWHNGVIGIVCSRLTEKYNLPSILISFEQNRDGEPKDTDIGKGSGRSIPGLNLFEALKACSHLLTKYGGHELAAGLSIERKNLEEFRRAINKYAADNLKNSELLRPVDIDMLINPEEITGRFAEELYLLEPYGTSNPQPIFESDRMIITDIIPLSGGKHTKLILKAPTSKQTFTALFFGVAADEFSFKVGEGVDIVYNLDINDFRGRREVQILLRDIRPSWVNNPPVRDDFVKLYTYLKSAGFSMSISGISELAEILIMPCDTLAAVIDIFAELNILNVKCGEYLELTVIPTKGKIPLESSGIYASILNAAN